MPKRKCGDCNEYFNPDRNRGEKFCSRCLAIWELENVYDDEGYRQGSAWQDDDSFKRNPDGEWF